MARIARLVTPAVRNMPIRRIGAVMSAYFLPAHRINPYGGLDSTYLHIVNEGLGRLQPMAYRQIPEDLPLRLRTDVFRQAPEETPSCRPVRGQRVFRRVRFDKLHRSGRRV